MNKFKWETEYDGKKYAIQCRNQREANNFCKEADKRGYYWENGLKRESDTMWNLYKENTCYDFEGGFSNFDWYLNNGYIILSWGTYMQSQIDIRITQNVSTLSDRNIEVTYQNEDDEYDEVVILDCLVNMYKRRLKEEK